MHRESDAHADIRGRARDALAAVAHTKMHACIHIYTYTAAARARFARSLNPVHAHIYASVYMHTHRERNATKRAVKREKR